MIKEFISKIRNRKDLSKEEAHNAMLNILEKAGHDEIYDFLTAMNEKEITVDELVGFANGMKEKAVSIKPDVENLIDTCGTGGDGMDTINISTGAAIIAASAGCMSRSTANSGICRLYVAKHGNYSVSSKSGSADVLKAFGYDIDASPENSQKMIENTCFGFLFAPKFYPAMSKVAPVRKAIGKKTIFNLLGPLCNPANARIQLIGVYEESLCEKFCYALKELNSERAFVVHGSGLDEISNIGETVVYELNNGEIKAYRIEPEDFGFKRYGLNDILGGSPEENAKELLEIFNGKKGAKRDIIVLNSAAALYLGKACSSLEDGVKKAEELLDSGAPARKLSEIVEYSQELNKT